MTTDTEAVRQAGPESDESTVYGQSLAAALAAHQSGLQAVGQLLVQMEEAPSLVTESAWKDSMAAALRSLGNAAAALTSLAPPPETLPEPAVYALGRAQKLLRGVGATTQALAGEWQRGVDEGDAMAIQQPRSHLQHIARDSRKALREMERARTATPRARWPA